MTPMTQQAKHVVTIDGIEVDIDAIRRIAHSCQPAMCKNQVSCCACYDVPITQTELFRIVGLLPEARRYATHLLDGDCDLFEEDGRNLSLNTDEDGLCCLAFRDANGAVLCSLHAAAMDMGLNPYTTKPKPCMLWPLTISTGNPRFLSVQDDAMDFPCNRPRNPEEPGLDDGIAAILKTMFNENFLDQLLQAIRNL